MLWTRLEGPGHRRAVLHGAGPDPRAAGPLRLASMGRTHPLTWPCQPGFLAGCLALREGSLPRRGGDAPLARLRRRACGDRARSPPAWRGHAQNRDREDMLGTRHPTTQGHARLRFGLPEEGQPPRWIRRCRPSWQRCTAHRGGGVTSAIEELTGVLHREALAQVGLGWRLRRGVRGWPGHGVASVWPDLRHDAEVGPAWRLAIGAVRFGAARGCYNLPVCP